MQYGVKHLVQCNCMLPQLKSKSILHKFLVFSIVDDNNKVQVKFAQCNNCNVIHKVTEVCKSTILNLSLQLMILNLLFHQIYL